MLEDNEAVLHIKTLGGLTIIHRGRPLTSLVSRKTEALLVYLACTEREHPRDVLADMLWDGRTQERAMANLRVVLSSLRKEIGSFVTITRTTAAINPAANLTLDARQLEEAAKAVQKQPAIRTGEQARQLQQALDRYKGNFLAGFSLPEAPGFESWAATKGERLHWLATDSLQRLNRWYLLQGDYPAAVAAASRLVQIDPLAETGHRRLMESLARNGRRTESLAQYEQCRQTLWQELGMQPETKTMALYQAIRQDNLPFITSTQKTAAKYTGLEPDFPEFLATALTPSDTPLPFIGRSQALTFLNQKLRQALSGKAQAVFIAGEAGVGKSTLVQEFARRATIAHPDLVMALGRNTPQTTTGAAYLPFRELLTMLVGEIEEPFRAGQLTVEQARRLWQMLPSAVQSINQFGPHLLAGFLNGQSLRIKAQTISDNPLPWQIELEQILDAAHAAGETDSSGLHQEFTAVLHTLARQRPLLLILEDLHWADPASLNLMFHLGRYLVSGPILLLGTFRPEQLLTAPNAQITLQQVLTEFKRAYGRVELNLDDVQAAEGPTFVDQLVDTEPNHLGRHFREALFAQTEGHPLFTVELLRNLQAQGKLNQDRDGLWHMSGPVRWNKLPAKIEGVLQERLAYLEPTLTEILTLASVEGETFCAQALLPSLDLDERSLIHQLSNVLERQHRLVINQGIRRVGNNRLTLFRFRHHLFQQFLYNNISEAERPFLHEDIGHALESLYQAETPKIAAQLAYHFSQANLPHKAIPYLLLAGDQAYALYAHEEAARHYEKAADFQKEINQPQQAAKTLLKLGLTHHLAFNYPQSRRAFNQAFALGQSRPRAKFTAHAPAPHPFRIPIHYEPETLDPSFTTTATGERVRSMLFSSLVTFNHNLEVSPELAHRWEVKDGGRIYLFHLHRDLLWSDGHPLTASDFAHNLHRKLDSQTRYPYGHLWFPIKGAQSYHQGASPLENVEIRTPDPYTLRIELKQPDSQFFRMIGGLTPVPSHVINRYGDSWTNDELFVSNGPFCLSCWDKGRRIAYTRNTFYNGRFPGNVEQVEHIVTPYDRQAELYENDEADIVNIGVGPEQFRRLAQKYPDDLITAPLNLTYGLAFDLSRPPFDNRTLRQAIGFALDQEGMADSDLQGLPFPGTGGFIPPSLAGHAPDSGLSYDPYQARALLAQAGFPGGRGFPEVRAVAGGATIFGQFARLREAVQTQLKEVLGIRINFKPQAWEDRASQDLRCFLAGWVAPPNYDPSFYVDFGTRSFQLQGYFPPFDQQLDLARRTLDQSQRLHHLREADRILVREAIFIPLIYDRAHQLLKPWIQNYLPTTLWKDIIITPH